VNNIDRLRVAAVRKLEAMGYTFAAGDWMQSANDAAAVVPAITDALHALLVARPDALINISTVMAGQRLGLEEVDDGILEQKTLQPIDNPFGTRVSPMS
jgi:hypothetical protein